MKMIAAILVVLLAVLLLLGGCTAHDKAPSPPPPPPAESGKQDGKFTIATDWSKLENSAANLPSIGSRWYDSYTDVLIPRDDYGPLIAYAGLRLMDDWPAITGCLYGLMTIDGVVVTDAVYSEVTSPVYHIGNRHLSHPLLVLRKGIQTNEEYGHARDLAIAANDGSWCTEFNYRGILASKDSILLFEDDRITHMSPTGAVINIWTMDELGLTQEEINAVYYGLEWGENYFGNWADDYFSFGYVDDWQNNEKTDVIMLHISTGKIEKVNRDDFWDFLAQRSVGNQSELTPLEWNGSNDDYPEIYFLWDQFSVSDLPTMIQARRLENGGVSNLYFYYDGTPLPEFTRASDIWYYSVRPVGGLIEVLDLNTASYYDLKTMDCVFRTDLGYYAD